MKFSVRAVFVLLASTLAFSSFNLAEARRNNRQEMSDTRQSQKNQQANNNKSGQSQAVDESASDSDIVRAARDQRRVDFVEGGSLVVTKLLPDDRSGLKHQKWVVRLSSGQQMEAVYNLDMCPRVQLSVGDVIAMGGQFVWTKKGPLLHWLHHDPRGNRPDGYVYVNGKYYCKE